MTGYYILWTLEVVVILWLLSRTRKHRAPICRFCGKPKSYSATTEDGQHLYECIPCHPSFKQTLYGYNAKTGMTYPNDPEESWKSAIDPLGPR